jgi:hypothetical protein
MSSSAVASSSKMATVTSTIQLLQSQIFQTSHNPQNIRTGAKYLRKRLRGPAMIQYTTPSFYAEREKERFLAASKGEPQLTRKGREKGGKIVLPEGGGGSSALLSSALTKNSNNDVQFTKLSSVLKSPDFHPAHRPSPYHPSTIPGASADGGKIDPEFIYQAIKDHRASAASRGDVPDGFQPVAFGPAGASLGQVSTNKGEGPASYGTYAWLGDESEKTRKEEVRVRRIEGRGPPKKGEGRRSQMKRK